MNLYVIEIRVLDIWNQCLHSIIMDKYTRDPSYVSPYLCGVKETAELTL